MEEVSNPIWRRGDEGEGFFFSSGIGNEEIFCSAGTGRQDFSLKSQAALSRFVHSPSHGHSSCHPLLLLEIFLRSS